MSGVTDVVASPDGEHVYALSVGAGVSAFDRDAATGELTPILGTAGCINERTRGEPDDPATAGQCAPARAMDGAFELAISPDGENVYVASRRDDAVAVLDRNALTGSLTQAAAPAGCVSETGESVPGVEETENQCVDGKGLLQAEGIAISPDGGTVYVPSSERDTLAVLDRDPATGALANLAGADGCAARGNDAMGNISYAAPDGFQTCKDGGRNYTYPNAVGVSPDNTSVYTTSAEDDSMHGFQRDPATGALTTIVPPEGCIKRYKDYDGCTIQDGVNYPAGIAFRPDGRRVYVASADAHGILTLVRDPATGALSPRGGTASCNRQVGTGCAPGRASSARSAWPPAATAGTSTSRAWGRARSAVFRAVPLRLTPSLTDFFIQERGTASAERTVTVRNDGDASVQISGVSLVGAEPGDFTITGGTCPGPALAPGAACTVTLRFTPSVRGRVSAKLRITSNSPTSPDDAELKGIGIVTLPPPPGVVQLDGVDRYIAETGREFADDPATAGRCRDGRALGASPGERGPSSVVVAPNNTDVYTSGAFRSSGQPPALAAIARFQRDTTTGLLTQPAGTAGCITHTGDGGTCGTASRMLPQTMRLSPDGKNASASAR